MAVERIPEAAILMPQIWYAFNEHHLDFPGTIAVQWQNFISYVVDVGKSVAHHGFRLLPRAWPFVQPYKRHLAYLFLGMIVALPFVKSFESASSMDSSGPAPTHVRIAWSACLLPDVSGLEPVYPLGRALCCTLIA